MVRPPEPNRWMPDRQRLDEALAARGLYPSRARARDAVLRGVVHVDGVVARKPAQAVSADSQLIVNDEAQAYVSRAGLKLKHGLDLFGIRVKGRRCLDIGASTGGFTQVLIAEGAAHVTAVDVGHGQMQLSDSRITSIEGLNARDLNRAHLPGPVDMIVCDVSFISLKLVLPPALSLAEEGADLVALIKPQFEAGRAALGKGGIVSDPAEHARVCAEIRHFLAAEGWRVLGVAESPVAGGDGNREFLIVAQKQPD